MTMRADNDILEYCRLAQQPDVLKGARNAAPRHPVERFAIEIVIAQSDMAGARCHEARNHVDDGGFTRAVRPDKTGDAAALDRERKLGNGLEAAETLADALKPKGVHARPSAPHRACRGGAAQSPAMAQRIDDALRQINDDEDEQQPLQQQPRIGERARSARASMMRKAVPTSGPATIERPPRMTAAMTRTNMGKPKTSGWIE